MKKVTGWIFVVPNVQEPLSSESYIRQEYFADKTQSDWDSLDFDGKEDVRMFEFELKGKRYRFANQWVQVWAQNMIETKIGEMNHNNRESNNFACHGFYDEDGGFHRFGFPTYLPAQMFAGKVEGDIVVFEDGGIVFELELAQRKGRYKRFGDGRFENVLHSTTGIPIPEPVAA